MADDSNETSSSQKQTCYAHITDSLEDVRPFNETTWSTFVKCVEIWKDLEGNAAVIARGFVASHDDCNIENLTTSTIPKDGGCHRKCYQYFTDSTKQQRAILAKEKRKASSTATVSNDELSSSAKPPDISEPVEKRSRLLRSSVDKYQKDQQESPHVLPKICIICRSNKYIKDKLGRRQLQGLSTCALVDGGLLLKAARLKEDHNLLMHINKDCVAIEVRYHRVCYRNYTALLTRPHPTGDRKGQIYCDAFKVFCETIIQQNIIRDKEIFRLTKLKKIFDKVVRNVEGNDSSTYRAWSLKQRLRSKFPQLNFLQPNRRNESVLVYVDNLATEELVEKSTILTESSISSDTDTTDTDSSVAGEECEINTTPVNSTSFGTLHHRYTSALDLKEEIRKIPSDLFPWPPTSTDLTLDAARQIVPCKLFNFLAWVVGSSSEPSESEFLEISEGDSHRILSIAQDIIYLATKGKKIMPKHSSLGMAVRHLSGSAQLIGLLNGFGHCISHTSILELDTALAEKEINSSTHLLPSCLATSTFTTLVWDNNDFGEETLSGKGTTHNTNGIAVQHAESYLTSPVQLPTLTMKRTRQRTLQAPDVNLISFRGAKKSSPATLAPTVSLEMHHHILPLQQASQKDFVYYLTKIPNNRLLPSWTGFNQLLTEETPPKATVGYLPVIDASPTDLHTVNTILHQSVEIADKLKLPSIVVVMDQAIYAKAQTIRWQTPLFMDRIVIRLGAFHTTMTALACIGKRFCDAGLQDILIESGVVATGSVNGVMNGHHYNRSIRCHKIMAEALHQLRWQSFRETVSEVISHKYDEMIQVLHSSYPNQQYLDVIEEPAFKAMMTAYDDYIRSRNKDATFTFWCSYLDMVENVLLFTRATRDGEWPLHLSSIRALLPWMFAYDRTNYSRYLPIYWLEMHNLEETHPFVFNELQIGNFAVQRQDSHGFSRVACDMMIEQTANRDSKTRGGIKSFSTNRGATNRWIRAHHERGAITRQCEEMAGKGQRSGARKDLTKGRMIRDRQDVQNILETISSMIDPFDNIPETEPGDLIHLSSGVIASPQVCNDLLSAHEKGTNSFVTFCKERLQGGNIDLNKTLSKLKLHTFTSMAKTVTTKVKGKEISLRSDRDLMARLVIIGKCRNIDLKNMLSHCLGPLPLPIATHEGCLVKTNKAKLLHYLESCPDSSPIVDTPMGSVWIVDGMAMLQQMSPKFMPDYMGQLSEKILRQLVNLALASQSSSIHFVTDRYPEESIKNAERKRRAACGTEKIKISKPTQPIPKQWKKFLAHGYNKEQFVEFLFQTWSKCDVIDLKGVTVVVAHGKLCHIISPHNGRVEVRQVIELNCCHEDADTRMFLHASYIAKSCNNSIVIKSPDTDVFVMGVAFASSLGSSQLYFHTGKDDNVRTIHLNAINQHLGEPICKALIGFHCFTGCDSVSAFYGKGKTKAIKCLVQTQTFCSAFETLGETFMVSDVTVTALEKFVCQLYGKPKFSSVNDVRYAMFSMAIRAENVMPPNHDALRKHTQRANYQAAIYKRSFEPHPEIPSPVGNGWKLTNNTLDIDWMDMAPAQESVLDLAYCTCKKSKCKAGVADNKCCVSLGVPCTELCTCKSCANDVCLPTAPNEDEEDEVEDDEVEEGDAFDNEENFND